MTHAEAAAWARFYAAELEKGGWTDDAARFRREAVFLELLSAETNNGTGVFEGSEWNEFNGMGRGENGGESELHLASPPFRAARHVTGEQTGE